MDATLTTGKNALVCMDNPEYGNYVKQTLEALGFTVFLSHEIEDSVVRIRISNNSVIVIFAEMCGLVLEENPVWRETQKMALSSRRKTYIALISSMLPTHNEMLEFIYSVELIVNAADVANLGMLINRGVENQATSYVLFNALSRPKALIR